MVICEMISLYISAGSGLKCHRYHRLLVQGADCKVFDQRIPLYISAGSGLKHWGAQ